MLLVRAGEPKGVFPWTGGVVLGRYRRRNVGMAMIVIRRVLGRRWCDVVHQERRMTVVPKFVALPFQIFRRATRTSQLTWDMISIAVLPNNASSKPDRP